MPDLKVLSSLKKYADAHHVQLVAVSKTKPMEDILEVYKTGQKIFGENKVQELVDKYEALPKDIVWHMIGHLQRNKVKYIAPFVALIHGVDSLKLLKEINKQGQKSERIINCLLQVHIAKEDTKFGFSEEEASSLFQTKTLENLSHVKIIGLMGMATNTNDEEVVRSEFRKIAYLYKQIKNEYSEQTDFKELSIGMSNDYKIAVEEGSTMIRVGSAIFGTRNL